MRKNGDVASAGQGLLPGGKAAITIKTKKERKGKKTRNAADELGSLLYNLSPVGVCACLCACEEEVGAHVAERCHAHFPQNCVCVQELSVPFSIKPQFYGRNH